MTNSHLRVLVHSSDKELGKFNAVEVKLPAFRGQVGIRADHADYGGAMSVGVVELVTHSDSDNQSHVFFVSGGFFMVQNNEVTLLTEVWQDANHLDLSRAEKARKRALERLETSRHHENVDVGRALAALKRAETRLAISQDQRQRLAS
ncbi:MAG: ATP synthase F1 subunit epsilon [Proteobacteria bacterium]|nr:ATP synthase F1 subunit epsilon [Pseudomonadota bacterium]